MKFFNLEGRQERGFTLIELLVVIAIIGILSSVVLASVRSAQKKGRDARRLQDLKQISNAVALLDSGATATAFSGCTGAGVRVTTCTTPDLTLYLDPSGATTACTTSSAGTCDYAIGKDALATAGATTQAWEVCAYLETGSGPRATLGTAGLVRIDADGTIKTGCN